MHNELMRRCLAAVLEQLKCIEAHCCKELDCQLCYGTFLLRITLDETLNGKLGGWPRPRDNRRYLEEKGW